MQHFASKLLHEDGGRYQRVSCTQSGRRSRRQMLSTKATTLNSEQNVIKVLLLSLHLRVAQTPCHASCCACASSAGPRRHAPAGETSCSSRSPPTSVVQISLQLQEIVNRNLGQNVKQIDQRLQTDNLQGQFLLTLRAVATDWASAVSAECDYTRCTHYLGTSIYYLDLLKCDWPHPNWTMRGMQFMHKPATIVQICLL